MYGIPGNAMLPPPHAGQPMSPMVVQKNIVRIGEMAFWSAQRYGDAIAVASTSARVFSVAQGGTGQGWLAGLTLPETNLRIGGQIPAQFAYDVEAIACQIYYINNWSMTRADIANAQNHAVVLWDFSMTTIEVAPVSLIGAGGGIYGATADTGAVEDDAAAGRGGARAVLNNGMGQLWIYRRHPVSLPSGAVFAMLLTWGANADPILGGPNASAIAFRLVLLGRFQSAIPTA